MLFSVLASTASLLFAQPPAPAPERYQHGVTLRLFQLEGNAIKAVPKLKEGQTPNVDELRQTIDWKNADFPTVKAPFLSQVIAQLETVVDGDYVFRITSDDGSLLTLDTQLVIDHNGTHGATAKESKPIHLAPGRHPILIEHFDHAADRVLKLEWRPPGAAAFAVVPTENLFAEIDNARVTSPGVKALADARRPGDGVPITAVHPSFKLDTIKVDGFDPMVGCMAFASDGRLIVGTFNPLQRDDVKLPDIESKKPDKLYALTGVLGEVDKVTVKVCADGLYEPLGLCSVGDALYVSHRRAITRLLDKDHDGFYETHEDVASGWAAWNYHQFTFGLVHRPDVDSNPPGPGWLYATLSTAMAPPKWEGMGTNAAPNDPLRGTAIEVDLSNNTFRVIAGGLRAPNGIGWGPRGHDGVAALFYCDNQGTWMPSNHMGEIVIDGNRFFGHYNNPSFVPQLADRFPSGGIASTWCDHLRARPALDLTYADLANSPTQPVLIESGPYRNQMLIGELTGGGIRRACMEQVDGQWQGAVFQFSQGFDVGINRMAWGPDGVLMAGGIGAGGNWNWKEKRSGLHRLTPTGNLPFEMSAVRAMPDGFDVQFTRDIDAAWLANPANYTVRQWDYEPTDKYGGEKQHIETLKVAEAKPTQGATSRRVFLRIPGLKEERTVLIRTDPVSTAGEQIWTTECYYTLNHIPRIWSSGPPFPEPFALNAAPPSDGTILIGRSARAAFSTPKETGADIEKGRTQKEIMASGWEGFTDVGNGDLLSRASFGDCRLHVEWYAPPGGEGQKAGNSGVYLQDRYEVQILGTPKGDKKLESNETGSIYKVRAPDVNASTGPGTWQAYDILFTAPRFENGKKTANARLTLYWNGILVHRAEEIAGPTGAAAVKGESDHGGGGGIQLGQLRLQSHETDAEGPVRFRNVWIAPLDGAPQYKTHPWRDLLAAGNLDAFVTRGGAATYRLEAGELIGTTAPNTANTFLVTKDRYGDFELIAEVKIDPALNSGIQIRSDIDGRKPDTAIDATPRDGRVRGYQVEIDPSPRAYTGGIYDEARRGWLYPLTDNPAARASFKPNDWNQIHVIARGERIQTYINGLPAADLFDAMDAGGGGHVAFQVHGVGDKKEPLEVRFRNVRVRRLE
jgi:hypothetical protein